MKPVGFLKKMFGASESDRLEESRELWEKAANSYKMADAFAEAGHCYDMCAEIERKTEGMPSNYMSEALNCYKKCDPDKYIELSEKSVLAFCKEGRISQAARIKREMGETLEEMAEIEKAAKSYRDAGRLYEKENQPSQANQNFLKAADLFCLTKNTDWAETIVVYENVIKSYLKKDMLRSSAKGIMLKCLLCYLAHDDAVGAERKFTQFQSEDPGLRGAREGEFLAAVIDAKKDSLREVFDSAVTEYTRITPFHKVETAILATVADTMGSAIGATGGPAKTRTVENEEELKLDEDGGDDLDADFS